MLRKAVFAFAVLGLALASAKSYTVNLPDSAYAGSTQLKPGEYQVEVDGDKVVFRNGKVDSQSPAKVETAATKFSATTLKYGDTGGKRQILEIRLGGTKTRIVLTEATPL